ncbi:hypothetical protein QYM36_013160 [Artemia franciscana]|uniref:Uncharacterized protein n=1 Tax=Artemia franciscana TaxID=6661 RepID=A0AA88HR47_ARTSF|nr:hypothetical protein QYM36_013160 [Artemia franciscana]
MVEEDAPQSVLDQINAKLGLLPQVMTEISFIKGQLTQINAENQRLSQELVVTRKELSEANRRIRYIETEAKRTNLIIYNLGQRDPPLPTLKEEVLLYLNTRISSLELHRSEVKDVFRMRSGAILLKLQCADTRNFILKSGRAFRNDGVSMAPDYTLEERNARSPLKIVINQAIEEGKPVRLRGTKLFVDGTLLVYDEESKKVEEVTRNNTTTPRSLRRRSDSPSSMDSASSAQTVVNVAITAEIHQELNSQTSATEVSAGQSGLNPRPKPARKADQIISPEEHNRLNNRSQRPQREPIWKAHENRGGPRYDTPNVRRGRSTVDYYRINYPDPTRYWYDENIEDSN